MKKQSRPVEIRFTQPNEDEAYIEFGQDVLDFLGAETPDELDIRIDEKGKVTIKKLDRQHVQ
jgi:hypothetical protein